MTKNEKTIWIATYAAAMAQDKNFAIVGSFEAEQAARRASAAVAALRKVRCHPSLQQEIDEILFGEET